MSENPGTFVFGAEDDAKEPQLLQPAGNPYELTIIGTPVIQGKDDGSAMRLSLTLVCESEPLSSTIYLNLFLPDPTKELRMYNDNLLALQRFEKAFNWQPPRGLAPAIGQEFPELTGQRAWANVGIKKGQDRPDENTIKSWHVKTV